MALNIPSRDILTMEEADNQEDEESYTNLSSFHASNKSLPIESISFTSNDSNYGNSSIRGSHGHTKSTRSYDSRHCSGDSLPISYNSDFSLEKIYIFDMRSTFEKIVKGKPLLLNVPHLLIKQRVASKENTDEKNLILKNVDLKTGIDDKQSHILIAILDECRMSDITLFVDFSYIELNMGKFSLSCITLPEISTTEDLLRAFSIRESHWPFCEGKKLGKGSLLESNLINPNLIVLHKLSPIVFRCLYRYSYLVEHIYSVPCLSTDTIIELRQKIKLVMLKTTHNNDNMMEIIKSSRIWLTYGNHIFEDHECIGLGSVTDRTGGSIGPSNTDDYDLVIHLQTQKAIGVSLSYERESSGCERSEQMFIPRNISSLCLRHQVAALTHCSPNALKITVNDKKLPEKQTLSLFSELTDGCKLKAGVRQKFSVNVKVANELYTIYAYKLDLIIKLKKNLGEKMDIPCIQIKLMLDNRELIDCQTLDNAHIKDQTEISGEIFKDRQIINIRKCGSASKFVVIDNFNKVQIKDIKVFCRRMLDVDSSLDIELRTQNASHVIRSDMYLSQTFDRDNDKYVLYVVVKKKQFKTNPHVFFCDDQGRIEKKEAVVRNNKIYVAQHNSPENDFPSDDDSDQDYHTHSMVMPSGIREAYKHESYGKISPEEDDELLKSHAYLDCQVSLVSHSRGYINQSPIRQSKSCPDTFVDTSPTSMGIVTDSELDELVKKLPGDNWQPFMRELVTHETITKQKDVKQIGEQMFSCLKLWKNREGKKATKRVLQDALIKHDLKLVAENVFGVIDDVQA